MSGREIANIDFAAMLGGAFCLQHATFRFALNHVAGCWYSNVAGPLSAVVRAQAAAAKNTVNFINQVGFRENRSMIYMDFKYTTINGKYTNVLCFDSKFTCCL